MNRRQKIIISVTGIFIVLLLLVGLTYGYFLTKINGNNNSKSISVSTANLQLVYGNDDGNVIGDGELIVPNTTFDAKTFTVTNKGNADTDYVVVIENATNNFKYNDFVYTLSCTSDGESCTGVDTETTYPINGGVLVANKIEVGKTHTYSFTLKYVDTGSDQSDDMNKTLTGRINIKDISGENPYSSNTSLLSYNIINNAITNKNGTTLTNLPVANTTFAYKTDDAREATSESSLSISTGEQDSTWIYGTGYTVDESTGKFTLTGGSSCKYNDGSCNETLVGKYIASNLSDTIVNCNIFEGEEFCYTPSQSNLDNIAKVTVAPASSSSSITMKVKEMSPIAYSPEKELNVTSDDYGTSYYYRGGVEDNYVNFAGMCWRIVRIEGDGSTKLILEDQSTTCNSSTFTGNWSGIEGNSTNYDKNAFKSFQISKLADYTSKLKAGDWCYDNTSIFRGVFYDDMDFIEYGAYTRIYSGNNPSLICTGTKLTKYSDGTDIYVGTLTADEISFAGAKFSTNYGLYLLNDYAKTNELRWISLSPSDEFITKAGSSPFYFTEFGGLDNDGFCPDYRPAVSLASNTTISYGTGTKTDPYVVE